MGEDKETWARSGKLHGIEKSVKERKSEAHGSFPVRHLLSVRDHFHSGKVS